mgnify:CR=1 FL=1
MDILSPNSIAQCINFVHHPHIHHADMKGILRFVTCRQACHPHSLEPTLPSLKPLYNAFQEWLQTLTAGPAGHSFVKPLNINNRH